MGHPLVLLLFALTFGLLLAGMWGGQGVHPLAYRWRCFGGLQPRQALVLLSLSAAGLVAIVSREGYRERAYPDPVLGKAVPTLGFGTTGPDVKVGDTTTPVAALSRALVDVQKFEGAIKRCVQVPLHQHEYDAYVSLAYNIGAGAFCNNSRGGPSTLVSRLNALDYEGACNAILLYDRAGPVTRPQDLCSHPDNRSCRGVWRDRLRLQARCLGDGGTP